MDEDFVQLSKKFINHKCDEKQKPIEEYKVNETIDASFVRLIDENGKQLGVFSRVNALYKAKVSKFDLVEVSSSSNPPVCKLMNYGKFKYKQKRKVSKTKKTHSILSTKEIKFRPKTELHDFVFKMKNLKRFLIQGKRVKVTIVFKGREIMHIDIGKKMLQKILLEIKDISTLDSSPKMEGKQLIIVASPILQKINL